MLGLESRPAVVHRQAYEGLATSVLSDIIKRASLGAMPIGPASTDLVSRSEASREGDGGFVLVHL